MNAIKSGGGHSITHSHTNNSIPNTQGGSYRLPNAPHDKMGNSFNGINPVVPAPPMSVGLHAPLLAPHSDSINTNNPLQPRPVSHSQVPVMYNNNRLMGPPGSHPPSTGVSAGPALPQPPIVSSNSSNGTQVFSTSELGQHSNFPCQTHFPVNANSGSASSASPKQVDTKKGSNKETATSSTA